MNYGKRGEIGGLRTPANPIMFPHNIQKDSKRTIRYVGPTCAIGLQYTLPDCATAGEESIPKHSYSYVLHNSIFFAVIAVWNISLYSVANLTTPPGREGPIEDYASHGRYIGIGTIW